MKVIGLWRRRPQQGLILCVDDCHAGCPLAGRRTAPRDEWDTRCTCPGADASRRSFEASEQRRAEMAAAFADVQLSDRSDPETLERRLREAFLRHGQQPPPVLTGMSRVIAAGNGARGTRTARSVGLGVRAAGRAVRWAWQPGTDDAQDRRSLRRMYLSLAVVIGIDGALTAVAVRSPGWRRLPWAVIALVAWHFTARFVALGALVTTVTRLPKGQPKRPEM